jgi:hypothetical protein
LETIVPSVSRRCLPRIALLSKTTLTAHSSLRRVVDPSDIGTSSLSGSVGLERVWRNAEASYDGRSLREVSYMLYSDMLVILLWKVGTHMLLMMRDTGTSV